MSSETWNKGISPEGDSNGHEGSEIRKVVFQPLPEGEPPSRSGVIAPQFHDVSLTLSAELGRIKIRVRDLINLEKDSVLRLNRVADEKVLILINDTPFAQGEIVVINDRFGVRITSLVSEIEEGGDQKTLENGGAG